MAEDTSRRASEEDAEAMSYVVGHYSPLAAFAKAAAQADDAIVMWRY